jgi:hypothetical protein
VIKTFAQQEEPVIRSMEFDYNHIFNFITLLRVGEEDN